MYWVNYVTLRDGITMSTSFEQLSDQLILTRNSDERKILLESMAPVGTFEQLSDQLILTRNRDERRILLEGMAKPSVDRGGQITQRLVMRKQYDIFIAHASEDKDFVTPLARSLKGRGLEVWYDDFVLKVGDSLRREIDRGLAQSRYGVVVLSRNFFRKHYPQKELDGLAAREEIGKKVILPIWHDIDKEEIISHSPTLADIVAVKSDLGVEAVTDKIIEAIS